MIYLYSPSKFDKSLPDNFVSNRKKKTRKKRSLKVFIDIYIRYLVTILQREHPTYVELDIASRIKLTIDNVLKLKLSVIFILPEGK